MTLLTKVVALYSGQGMANLVEFYNSGDDQDTPDALALLDFGGNVGKGQKAIKYVTDKLEEQAKASRRPKLDLMVISHQDKDHHNLLTGLKKAIQSSAILSKFSVGEVYSGGANWTTKNKRSLDNFLSLSTLRAHKYELQMYRSDYNVALDELFHHQDVSIRVLVGQLAIPESAGPDMVLNGSSAVVVVENSSSALVFPGDATYHTMKAINEKFEEWEADPERPRMMPVQVMEIPHHGAIRTAVENYDAQRKTPTFNFDIVTDFAENMDAHGVFASAGPINSFGHPIEEVIAVFKKHTIAMADHTYVAAKYDERPSGKSTWSSYYFIYPSDRWIQTTTVGITYPNPPAPVKADRTTIKDNNIEIKLRADGTVTMRSDRSLDEILAQVRPEEAVEAAPQTAVVYAPAPPVAASRIG